MSSQISLVVLNLKTMNTFLDSGQFNFLIERIFVIVYTVYELQTFKIYPVFSPSYIKNSITTEVTAKTINY